MIYIRQFIFPGREEEDKMNFHMMPTYRRSTYPYGVFYRNQLKELKFTDITILYGNNGSGKTTALNLIAEKIGADRDALFNSTDDFSGFLSKCDCRMSGEHAENKRIITSDDVFDFMLNLRAINSGIVNRRGDLLKAYEEDKEKSRHQLFHLSSLQDYDELKRLNLMRRTTSSSFVRRQVPKDIYEHSNGESGYIYFTERMEENGLYLLDEPENSLAPVMQRELVKFLEEQVRFFKCQLIIATHSPFFLSMKRALIYDLDSCPVVTREWTELPNVRAYMELFRELE